MTEIRKWKMGKVEPERLVLAGHREMRPVLGTATIAHDRGNVGVALNEIEAVVLIAEHNQAISFIEDLMAEFEKSAPEAFKEFRTRGVALSRPLDGE